MNDDCLNIFHPLDHKAYEFAVAVYVFCVGGLFFFFPQTLDAPVYNSWHELGPTYWGIALVCISFMHFFALKLNGYKLSISQPIRLIAIFSHLGVSLQFAKMFFEGGATWGSITYGVFVPLLLLLIARNVMRFYLKENDNAHSR